MLIRFAFLVLVATAFGSRAASAQVTKQAVPGVQNFAKLETTVACGGATTSSHDLALQRLRDGGAQVTSWLQLLLELQRDWTRPATYAAARGIVESHAGGYGIGLAYARDMLTPPSAPAASAG